MKVQFERLQKLYIIFLYLFIIILPFQVFLITNNCSINPAIELAIIYYFLTYRKVKITILCIISIFFDKLHGIVIGSSLIGLVIANIYLYYVSQRITHRNNFNNFLLFVPFCLIVSVSKFFIVVFLLNNNIDNFNFIIHLITTILSYPIIKTVLSISEY